MGLVYLAYDRVSRVSVAVKELSDDFELNTELLARQVSHPNICRINDLFCENGKRLLSMEYVEGETLRARIERQKRIPAVDLIPIALQALDALAAAHAEGVVHCDIKPANIMITTTGKVKLMDFGLARSLDAESTHSEMARGTPAYMPPEQRRGDPATPQTDLYLLGATLYHAVSGTIPYLDLPDPLPADVPELLRGFILRCIQIKPEHRFPSAATAREALFTPRRGLKGRAYEFATVVLIAVLAVIGSYRSLSTVRNFVAQTLAADPVPVAPPNAPTLAVLIDGTFGDQLQNAMARQGHFRIVERSQLNKALVALQVESLANVDSATAQKAGAILGAKYLMLGSSVTVNDRMTAQIRIVRTETLEHVGGSVVDDRDARKTNEIAKELVENLQ